VFYPRHVSSLALFVRSVGEGGRVVSFGMELGLPCIKVVALGISSEKKKKRSEVIEKARGDNFPGCGELCYYTRVVLVGGSLPVPSIPAA